MRIAQVAPLVLPVPPGRYGGTERVIHDLTEALVARGHDVTLFASGDSRTSAKLVPSVPRALWQGRAADWLTAGFVQHAEAFRRDSEFDVIHTHTAFSAFPYARHAAAPVVTTLHGRLDVPPEFGQALRLFPEVGLVAISKSQQAQVPDASWAGVVPHGLPLQQYEFGPRGGEAIVCLSRICVDKAQHVAIDVAVEAGLPLTLAGRIDPIDTRYFETEIEPRLRRPGIRYVGEVSDEERLRLLRSARALLFPIDWPEPFGLVMIEAMALGTPVVARPKGAAPEVVVDGVTGFLADSHEALVDAVHRVGQLDRAACRRHVEANYGVDVMTSRYEELYRGMRRAGGIGT